MLMKFYAQIKRINQKLIGRHERSHFSTHISYLFGRNVPELCIFQNAITCMRVNLSSGKEILWNQVIVFSSPVRKYR